MSALRLEASLQQAVREENGRGSAEHGQDRNQPPTMTTLTLANFNEPEADINRDDQYERWKHCRKIIRATLVVTRNVGGGAGFRLRCAQSRGKTRFCGFVRCLSTGTILNLAQSCCSKKN